MSELMGAAFKQAWAINVLAFQTSAVYFAHFPSTNLSLAETDQYYDPSYNQSANVNALQNVSSRIIPITLKFNQARDTIIDPETGGAGYFQEEYVNFTCNPSFAQPKYRDVIQWSNDFFTVIESKFSEIGGRQTQIYGRLRRLLNFSAETQPL